MKRTISGLLALLLLLCACVGCGSNDDPVDREDENNEDRTENQGGGKNDSIFKDLVDLSMDETVLEMDGNEIPADMYLCYLMSVCYDLGNQLSFFSTYYGMYTETIDEDGSVKWEESVEGTPLVEMAREQAENNAMSHALLENVAKAHGLALTEEDQADLEEVLSAQIEQAGGEEGFQQNLYEQGLSMKSYRRMVSDTYLYQHLLELAADPSSEIYEAPSDDNAYVDHILLSTVDTATMEPLSDEEIEAKKALAEELLAQLQAADPAELVDLFTQLADENGEDGGRATDTGYLINPDTNFVQEFKDAAFALKPGEISGIVESTYGYHIIIRKDLTDEQMLSLAAEPLTAYLDAQMEAALENVVRSEKLDAIDVGAVYDGYIEKLRELHPEETEDAADGGADGEDDATPGSTDGSAE